LTKSAGQSNIGITGSQAGRFAVNIPAFPPAAPRLVFIADFVS
jgi:hypothetical protein